MVGTEEAGLSAVAFARAGRLLVTTTSAVISVSGSDTEVPAAKGTLPPLPPSTAPQGISAVPPESQAPARLKDRVIQRQRRRVRSDRAVSAQPSRTVEPGLPRIGSGRVETSRLASAKREVFVTGLT